jgi:predicted site-specific integrase-resolvase
MAKQEQKFFCLSQAAHQWSFHLSTVQYWINSGRIQVGREARTLRAESEKVVGTLDGRLVALAARVSGQGQTADRDTRIERMRTWAAIERKGSEQRALSDVGSGLKAARRHLQRVFKLVCEKNVAVIVLPDDDHFTRFEPAYVEALCACFGVTLSR